MKLQNNFAFTFIKFVEFKKCLHCVPDFSLFSFNVHNSSKNDLPKCIQFWDNSSGYCSKLQSYNFVMIIIIILLLLLQLLYITIFIVLFSYNVSEIL